MEDLSWASAELRARHVDPHFDEGEHEHTWTVTVFWPSEPFRNLLAMRSGLEAILHPFQGTTLPPALWSSEDIAKMVLGVMNVIVGVKVDRPGIGGAERWS